MTRSPQSPRRRAWVEGQRHYLSPEAAVDLRRARLGLGLSVRKAARRVGIGYGYLSELERGLKCPSVDVAHALIDGLQLTGETQLRLLDEALPTSGRSWIPESRCP